MFGNKKNITDRVKDSVTEYIDEKFDQYRGQIAFDVSRGLAALAGLVALWSVAIISGIFLAITLALLIGWLLSFVMNEGAYLVSFGGMALTIIAGTYFLIKNRKQYIEDPVFKIMSNVLRAPSAVIEAQEKKSAVNKKSSKPSPALPQPKQKNAPYNPPKARTKEKPPEQPKESAKETPQEKKTEKSTPRNSDSPSSSKT
jgi:hypothetical protein